MKRLTLILAFLCYSLYTTAQVYVNQNASGLNDGSSWTNAFIDLQEALNSADSDSQIWVAAGTYKPASSANQNEIYFLLNKPLELYGGFSGTEVELSERDWENNITRINGDLNNDDVANIYSNSKEDNAVHNMIADVDSEGSIIDGFYFVNGWANTFPVTGEDPSLDELTGGGVLIYAPITVANCSFNQCSGFYGGAIGYRPKVTSDIELIIENCTIANNYGQLGNIYILDLVNGGIYNSTIMNNGAALAGGGFYLTNSNSTVENCIVENNECLTGFGGGIYINNTATTILESPVVELRNNQVNFNIAATGGGIRYFNGFIDAHFLIDSCLINNNIALRENDVGGTAGGLFITNSPINGSNIIPSLTTTVSNSFVEDNIGYITGGAYFQSSNDDGHEVIVENTNFKSNAAEIFGGGVVMGNTLGTFDNCTFDANVAIEANGGGLFLFNNDSNTVPEPLVQIFNCTFARNQGQIGGGLAFNNFIRDSEISIEGTDFISNTSENNIGGAIAILNSNSSTNASSLIVDVSSSLFEGNNAGLAGAISVYSNAENVEFTMSDSEFINNSATAVGSLELYNDGPRMSAEITSTKFIGNTDEQSSGGIYAFNVNDINIQQSEFTNNTSIDGGSAINNIDSPMTLESVLIHNNLNNYAINNEGDLSLKNTTIVDNHLGIFSSNSGTVEFQNTIISNNGTANFAENDNGTITTRGGNICSDNSLESYFIDSNAFPDFMNTDPRLDLDYKLQNDSPALDIGNPDGIILNEDLEGNPRIQGSGIDAGSYESSFNVSTNNLSTIDIDIFPNPFSDQLNISDTKGIEEITIFDSTGRKLSDLVIGKTMSISKDLTSGSYFLRLKIDGGYYVKKLEKME